MQTMLDTRNALWMPRILGRAEGNIVVAVGAAHLSGDAGLLAQLNQAGYSLSRAEF